MPATPGHCAEHGSNTTKSHIWGGEEDVVTATLVSYGSNPDVTEAFNTYVGSHTHLGTPYKAP